LSTLDLEAMSVDELWKLHEAIEAILTEKIASEVTVLQRHLDRLSPRTGVVQRVFRKSPNRPEAQRARALPKYRNPENPSVT
jgi:DNA-binding protein H-NS